MEIIKLFQQNILDNNKNSIKYFYTRVKKYYVIHIYNPLNETITLTKNNEIFFEKIIKMLFDKNNKERGCFNHEYDDNDDIYNKNLQELINRYISNSSYIIFMVDNLEPLSYLTLSNNMIWSVCTNILYRKNGYMTLLLNHVLKLIEQNKLNIDITLKGLKLTVHKQNPIKNKLIKYYNNFNFELISENYKYYTMEYKI